MTIAQQLATERYRLNYPDRVVASRKKTYDKFRAWLEAFKLARGCIDCGYNKHPAALQFDHVHGKKKRGMSFPGICKTMLVELSKCEVRCANCHAIRHFGKSYKGDQRV